MPEKDNNKSKKYYAFEVKLKPIKENIASEFLQKHIDEYQFINQLGEVID